jgi:BirA family transcriptional regulator, biotin operon repressor / biotin---[acetyl-CoA-carboxylase] ligase
MKQHKPLFVGCTRIDFDSLPSTNRYARELLESNPPEGTLITAAQQTEGKGLAGNSWYAEPFHNLSFSLIIYPKGIGSSNVFSLNILVSVALLNCLQELYPNQPFQIKWPNDLLLKGKKIAGILIENTWKNQHLHASIIGIGLNLNTRQFPENLQKSAASLWLETGIHINVDDFLLAYSAHFEALYLQSRNQPNDFKKQAYLAALWRYQEWAQYEWHGQKQEGMIIGVNSDGKLAIQTKENKVLYFDLKEIVYC